MAKARLMNQTRITARDPNADVHVTVMVATHRFETAGYHGVAGLCDLLAAGIRARGGTPADVEYTAEPIGPRIHLVAVNGARL